LTIRKPKLDGKVFAFDKSTFAQAPTNCSYCLDRLWLGERAEIPDPRHLRLLCASRERPCCRRAAQEGDELASPEIEHGDRVGKDNLHVAALIGAAMCSAYLRSSRDGWL
jgi:hypothetical protein